MKDREEILRCLEACQMGVCTDAVRFIRALTVENEVLKSSVLRREYQIVGLSQELAHVQLEKAKMKTENEKAHEINEAYKRGFDEAKRRFLEGFRNAERWSKW